MPTIPCFLWSCQGSSLFGLKEKWPRKVQVELLGHSSKLQDGIVQRSSVLTMLIQVVIYLTLQASLNTEIQDNADQVEIELADTISSPLHIPWYSPLRMITLLGSASISRTRLLRCQLLTDTWVFWTGMSGKCLKKRAHCLVVHVGNLDVC